jgi:hypothetical protein
MDYLTSGNACLKEGASLIAWGAFLTSLGWVLLGLLLGKYGDINRWLSKVKPFRKTVIRGIIAIMLLTGIFACIRLGLKKVGEGGTLTTKGWNLLNVHSQRQNLIRAVVQELLMNVVSLEISPIKGEVYYRKENGDVVPHPFPTLKTTAINAVMSSGLWDFGNQTEENFLYAIFDYERAIGTTNSIFGEYNDSLSNIIDPNKKIAQAEEYQKVASGKVRAYFKSLENTQNEVIKLLLSEYEWAIPSNEREKLVLLEKTRKGILEREHILETIRVADELVKQGELIRAKAKLEEIKDNEFLTEAEREQITKTLNKLDNKLDDQKLEKTLPKNQIQEVNSKSEAPSF